MKISTLQLIAVCCILAVAFMAAAPFVQDAGADKYKLKITVVEVILCKTCGTGVSAKTLGQMEIQLDHGKGEEHATRGVMYLYTPGPDTCPRCTKSS